MVTFNRVFVAHRRPADTLSGKYFIEDKTSRCIIYTEQTHKSETLKSGLEGFRWGHGISGA